MSFETHDVVVIDAGQAGLTSVYYLRRAAVSFVMLDADKGPGGEWRHAWKSLNPFAERMKVLVLIGHQRRHSPDIAKARQLVGSGELGRLVAVNGMWITDKPASYFDVEWRRQAGGGPLLMIGSSPASKSMMHYAICLFSWTA